MNPKVYLCGTITNDRRHLDWRKYIADALAEYNIGSLSPVRGKDPPCWRQEDVAGAVYDNGAFVARDYRDIQNSDALFVMFTKKEHVKRQSLGTWMELGYAKAMDIPVVIVTDIEEIADHPFIKDVAARICKTVDEGIAYTAWLLMPGVE